MRYIVGCANDGSTITPHQDLTGEISIVTSPISITKNLSLVLNNSLGITSSSNLLFDVKLGGQFEIKNSILSILNPIGKAVINKGQLILQNTSIIGSNSEKIDNQGSLIMKGLVEIKE